MSVTCNRFNRCARFAPKYSVVPLLYFFSWNHLFSNRVFLISTVTFPNFSAMRVTVARLMIGSILGRWLRIIQWKC